MDADISIIFFKRYIYLVFYVMNLFLDFHYHCIYMYLIAKFNDPRRDNRANATRELRGLMYSLGIYL